MRKLVTIIFGLGFIMVLFAAVVAIDGFATDERRAAVDAEIYARADANEDLRGRERRRDIVGRTARIIRDFKNGLFFSAPVDLAALMPPAPDGWVRRDYATADGEAITGETIVDGLNPPTTTRLLRDFSNAAEKTGKMSSVATYARGERLIAIRLVSETDLYRSLKRPDSDEAAQSLAAVPRQAGTPVLASLDGIPVFQEPQFSFDNAGRPVPVSYRRLTLNIGHLVSGEVITNAADADLAAILSGLDVAAFQNAMPRPTQHYAEGQGFVYLAGEVPSTHLPEPTPALRAYRLLGDAGLDKREEQALIAIAQGRARDWTGLKAATSGGNYPISDRLLAVLGPEPATLRAAREARGILAERGGDLADAETQALDKIARAQARSQAELRRYSWWSDDLDDEVLAVIALLPSE